MKAGTILKILLVLSLIAAAFYLYVSIQLGPYGKGGVVYIPRGASLRQSAEILEQNGAIRSAWAFRGLARWKKMQAKLKPGEYQLDPAMTSGEVLNKIVRGERVVRRVTVPEGYNFQQIAALIEKAGIAPQAETMKYFRDPGLLTALGFPAVSLEGYLFPASYEYDRETKVEGLLRQMLQKFQDSMRGPIADRAKQAGWSLPQVVTLASLIEKETAQATERPLISSVFQNRLRIGMPLQTDPTVIYGLPNFDGNIRRDDLRNPHAYNTYVHVGLPPGPIASPGLASLEAALAPAQSNYLFFVSKGDGTHYFSSTLDEHNTAVSRYQLGRAPGPESRPETQPTASVPVQKPIPMPRAPVPPPGAGNPQPLMKPIPMPRAPQ
ncbi:MAG: endolytic transglycosylase MltG [Deltaproteobacteria bacterium]|nr:endolytic transglycosylase MltG [Deltaproteobacteria bacterium]